MTRGFVIICTHQGAALSCAPMEEGKLYKRNCKLEGSNVSLMSNNTLVCRRMQIHATETAPVEAREGNSMFRCSWLLFVMRIKRLI